MKDYYAILELSKDVEEIEIKNKFAHFLEQNAQPNTSKSNSSLQLAEELEAMLMLKDANLRRKYDLLLKHKNNTEVRHSLKYKMYAAEIEKAIATSKSEIQTMLKLV